MLSAADNELLTRTDPGTGMGDYFRRFWQPVALSSELPEPDCPPLRVQILGERWLAFRDTNGRVGLVDPRCAHRGADLFFGRNEQCGLRCVYHGWKYDVDGRCVDLPNVPAKTAQHMQVSIRACPTREFGEIVWAYLGPGEPPPGPPALEVGLVPPAHRYVSKKLTECNWAHSIEGALDTAHFSFLHVPAPAVASDDIPNAQADARRLHWLRNDPQPRFTILEHDAGFLIGGARTADGSELYWRTTHFMLPSHATVPSTGPGETHFGYTWVPISDTQCWVYLYAWHPERLLDPGERARFQAGFGQFPQLGPGFVPVRNKSNDYLIDRADQKHRTFTGIRGVAEQDGMIQESQGLVLDRGRERLTATDAPIARFRRLMLAEAKALQAGREPAAARNPAAYTLRSGSIVADSSLPLEAVMQQRFGDPLGRVRTAATATEIAVPKAVSRST